MNLPRFKTRSAVLVAAAFLAFGGYILRSQTAPAPSTTVTKDQEAVKLDPFSVSADSDVGFVAASSLAGGRMATPLKDTPVAYSVVTREFLDAFNVGDAIEAAQWTTNANQNETDGGTRMYGVDAVTMLRTRGVKMGLPTKDYFTVAGTSDSYNLDRVDMARGPNSSLFGAGGVSGTMNSITKQAEPARPLTEFQLKIGSWDHFRFTGDINRPISNKIAVRVNVLFDTSDSWRDTVYFEKRGATLALKYNITPKFSVRGAFEYKRDLDGNLTASMLDYSSAWDGKTTISSYLPNGGGPTTPLTAAQLSAAGINRATEPQRFVESADWGHVFMNFQNRYQAQGATQNNDLTLTNRVNGVPMITRGMSLNRAALADGLDGVPADRWSTNLAGSPYFHIWKRSEDWSWTKRSLPMGIGRGIDTQLAATYAPSDKLFFEVAGAQNTSQRYGENTTNRGMIFTNLEINRTLPDGSPNPGFLKHYIDEFSYRTHKEYTIRQMRAQGVFKQDTRLGKLQFSVIGGINSNETYAWSALMFLPLKSLGPDARTWVDGASYGEYSASSRWYVNDGSPRIWRDNSNKPASTYNPLNGISETVTPVYMIDLKKPDNNYRSTQKTRFLQTAGNFDLFKNRLVITGAFRRDLTSIVTHSSAAPGQMPAGWDGTYGAYLPAAPADYATLTYFPKDATGKIIGPAQPASARPRARASVGVVGDHANVALRQYDNDRFRDDYSQPRFDKAVNTQTVGAVLNMTRWLGAYANASTTFNFTPPAQRVDGTLVPPTASKGHDYGIRMTLPNNRLSVSIGRFTSYQNGATLRASTGTNAIASVAPVGDLNPADGNIRGFKEIPLDTYSTLSYSADGWEFEATANLTRTWRLIVNAGYSMAQQKDAQPDIIAFYPANDAVMRQVLADAGVLIDASNNASINPAVNDPAKINQTNVQAAVDAWNTIHNVTIPNLATAKPRENPGNVKWVGNVATDYRFSSGPLRGLRVGGGVQYRGGQSISYKGSDTIRDPNNPANVLADPAGGPDVPLYAPGYYKGVMSLSYTMKLKESASKFAPKTIQFDFNVDNLFGWNHEVFGNINDQVQTLNTFFRPRVGEDITSPARRTVPGAFGYISPRNYTVSAKLSY